MMIRLEICIYLLISTIYIFADDNATLLLFNSEVLPTDEGNEEKRNESCIKEESMLKLGIGDVMEVRTNISHLSVDGPKGVINETLIQTDDTSSSSNTDKKDDKKVNFKEKYPKLLKYSQAIAKNESIKDYKKNGTSYVNTTTSNNVGTSNNNNNNNNNNNDSLSERHTETNNKNNTTNLKKSVKGKDILAKIESISKIKEKEIEMKIKEKKKRENKQEAITRRLRMLRMFLFK